MTVNGSGGERYILGGKGKKGFGGYCDYPVQGTGKYCARIFARTGRNASVEAEIKEAVHSGGDFEGERPLNVLYFHGKFAGFLYEGILAGKETYVDESQGTYSGNGFQEIRTGGNEQLIFIGTQLILILAMLYIGLRIVYPLFLDRISNVDPDSFAAALAVLDHGGHPAILTGIALQIYVVLRWKRSFPNLGVCLAVAAIANLAGMILWTCTVLAVVLLVDGVMSFLARYLISILFFLFIIVWIKKRFCKFF